MSGSPSQEIVSVNDEDEAVVDEMQEVVHKYQIGEPTDDYDIFESVAYSHNWFSKTQVDGESCASCSNFFRYNLKKKRALTPWQKMVRTALIIN